MTYVEDYSIPEEILEQICEEGFDALPELMTVKSTYCCYQRDYNVDYH